MLSKAAKRILVFGGVLILIGVLWLVNGFLELSPWVWAALLAGAGLGAFGLYLADRSAGLALLAAYVWWAIAGLIALVPSGLLRDEAVALYVLPAIALPFLAIFVRDRARWWALIPAYVLLTIVGVIGLTESGLFSDDLISAYVLLAIALPFFVIYAWDRKQWWALIPGGILAVIGLSFGSWLPWHSVRASLIAGSAVEYLAAFALLVAGAGILACALVGRASLFRNRIFCLFVLLAMLLATAACSSPNAPAEAAGPAGGQPLVIRNGTVIDGTGAEPIPDGIVIVEGERIVAVGREADIAVPSEAQVIDAEGGTILPGIIDSHVHTAWSPEVRRRYLEVGVTTVCDLGSPIERMDDFGQDTWNGNPVARGFRAGPIITAPGGLPDAVLHANLNFELATLEEARSGVTDLAGRGADVIKVYLHTEDNGITYPMLGEEELAAIVQEAHSLGLDVRAHVTYASLLGMAVQAGVDTVEHVPVNMTQSESTSFAAAQLQGLLQSDDPLRLFITELYPNYEDQLRIMAEAGIVMVPTLDLPFGDLYRISNPTREQEVTIQIILGIVRRFHELGGVVGLGTDYDIGRGMETGMPVGEMEMLSAAGLTPMEVIEAATKHAARVCGHGEDLGTLEAGKLADILIIAGDPVADLGVLEGVVLVVKGGKVAYGIQEEE